MARTVFEIRGMPGVQRRFADRKNLMGKNITKAQNEAAKIVLAEQKRLSPPYPLAMLKYGYRWWDITGELKSSHKINKKGNDITIGPTKDLEKWAALEVGHSLGYYGPRPWLKPSIWSNSQQNLIRAVFTNAAQRATRVSV